MSALAKIASVVQMERTSFRTYGLRVVGAPGGAAIRIVAAAHWSQRVVLDGALARVSVESNELDIPFGLIPSSGTFQAPTSILTLPPDQALFAAGAVVGAAVSVSVSQVIPYPRTPNEWRAIERPPHQTLLHQHALRPTGTPTSARRIAAAQERPLRVVVSRRTAAGFVRLTSEPNELSTAGAGVSGAYGFVFGTRIFILAPGQVLFAAADPGAVDPGGVAPVLSVSVEEIDPIYPYGATGIPGPDGAE
jgi:hypothetical protein